MQLRSLHQNSLPDSLETDLLSLQYLSFFIPHSFPGSLGKDLASLRHVSFDTASHPFAESPGKRFFILPCLHSTVSSLHISYAINHFKPSSAGHRRVGYSIVSCLGRMRILGGWEQLLMDSVVWIRLGAGQDSDVAHCAWAISSSAHLL